jgi:hypothetical protein
MNIQTIADRIKDLSPSDQLRMAADILDLAKSETARSLQLIGIATPSSRRLLLIPAQCSCLRC